MTHRSTQAGGAARETNFAHHKYIGTFCCSPTKTKETEQCAEVIHSSVISTEGFFSQFHSPRTVKKTKLFHYTANSSHTLTHRRTNKSCCVGRDSSRSTSHRRELHWASLHQEQRREGTLSLTPALGVCQAAGRGGRAVRRARVTRCRPGEGCGRGGRQG